MPSQIHVFNRNGTYYFRRRVPKDLLSLYPSSQIIFSLKTKDRREADRLARLESVRLDQEFQLKRTHLSAHSTGETGGSPVFPALKIDSHKSLTGNFSKWWGRYARKVIGIEDERKVLHSFRHSFKDACRNSGIHQEFHDAFTGHAGSNVGSTYGLDHRRDD